MKSIGDEQNSKNAFGLVYSQHRLQEAFNVPDLLCIV